MPSKKRQHRESELENFLFGSAEPEEKADNEVTPSTNTQQQQVWRDEDDDELKVNMNAVDRLKKLRPSSSNRSEVSGSDLTSLMQQRFQSRALGWLDQEEVESSDDDEVLQRSGGVLSEQSKSTSSIDIKRLVDANASAPTKLSINSVQFDSSGRVLLTAGEDKAVRLFSIDGENNDNILNMAIEFASFVNAGQQLIVAGRRNYFYSYDVTSGASSRCNGLIGKDKGLKSCELMRVSPLGSRVAIAGAGGYVHILCGRTLTWLADIKMNCGVRSLAFVSEDRLVTAGLDADIYEWDLRALHRNPKCSLRYRNEDGSAVSCLATYRSSDSGNYYIAAGSESGVVTVYNGSSANNAVPVALRSMMNLTTKITTLAIHPSGNLLGLASYHKKDQMRLSHVPSCHVYSNWPTEKTPLRRVRCMDFSPGGAYMAVGNNCGRVLLYKLQQFASA